MTHQEYIEEFDEEPERNEDISHRRENDYDFQGWQDGESNCCGSKVEKNTDICNNCGEHCEVIKEEELN